MLFEDLVPLFSILSPHIANCRVRGCLFPQTRHKVALGKGDTLVNGTDTWLGRLLLVRETTIGKDLGKGDYSWLRGGATLSKGGYS